MTDKNMRIYWEEQARRLSDIITGPADNVRPFVSLYHRVRPDRIYLVASGTSLNAAAAAAPFMSDVLGVEVIAWAPSLLRHVYGNTLMVYISQGGSSTNVLAAMERFSHLPGLLLTGYEDGKMQTGGQPILLIGCGPEDAGPKTKGYSCTIVTLYRAALEAAAEMGGITGQRYDSLMQALDLFRFNLPENLNRVRKWVERHLLDMAQIEKIVLVGKGGGGDAAKEGALKLLETLKVPALGFEFEEYLHGPIMMTNRALTGLFFITPDPDDEPRMRALAECHLRYGMRAFTVELGDTAADGGLALLGSGCQYTEVLEFVLSVQLIAALAPEAAGIAEGSAIYNEYSSRCPTKYGNGR